MRYVYFFMVMLFLSCGTKEQKTVKDPVVKFWTVEKIDNDGKIKELDSCTKQDYLDVREDHIAISFHCSKSNPDSIPSYHTHKLNWKPLKNGVYEVYTDDKVMHGTLSIDEKGFLLMDVDKSRNRNMKATFK